LRRGRKGFIWKDSPLQSARKCFVTT
jgi:hypothetical protein